MKVILKQDMENLGRRGDIVDVAPGYGRNYLIPKRLALEVTSSNMKMIEIERLALRKKLEKERTSYQDIIQKLTQTTLSFRRKSGEKDVIFGSVSSSDIKDALHEAGFEIDKKKILLEEPIKRLGNYTVPIKVFHDDLAEVKVEVVREEEETKEKKEEEKIKEVKEEKETKDVKEEEETKVVKEEEEIKVVKEEEEIKEKKEKKAPEKEKPKEEEVKAEPEEEKREEVKGGEKESEEKGEAGPEEEKPEEEKPKKEKIRTKKEKPEEDKKEIEEEKSEGKADAPEEKKEESEGESE
jgi:large subunit ribosomal protein L9